MNVMILFCAISQMHFCYLLFYMVFTLNAFIMTLAALGLLIQDAVEDD